LGASLHAWLVERLAELDIDKDFDFERLAEYHAYYTTLVRLEWMMKDADSMKGEYGANFPEQLEKEIRELKESRASKNQEEEDWIWFALNDRLLAKLKANGHLTREDLNL